MSLWEKAAMAAAEAGYPGGEPDVEGGTVWFRAGMEPPLAVMWKAYVVAGSGCTPCLACFLPQDASGRLAAACLSVGRGERDCRVGAYLDGEEAE